MLVFTQNSTRNNMSQKVVCKLQTLIHVGFKTKNLVHFLLLSMDLDQDY